MVLLDLPFDIGGSGQSLFYVTGMVPKVFRVRYRLRPANLELQVPLTLTASASSCGRSNTDDEDDRAQDGARLRER